MCDLYVNLNRLYFVTWFRSVEKLDCRASGVNSHSIYSTILWNSIKLTDTMHNYHEQLFCTVWKIRTYKMCSLDIKIQKIMLRLLKFPKRLCRISKHEWFDLIDEKRYHIFLVGGLCISTGGVEISYPNFGGVLKFTTLFLISLLNFFRGRYAFFLNRSNTLEWTTFSPKNLWWPNVLAAAVTKRQDTKFTMQQAQLCLRHSDSN